MQTGHQLGNIFAISVLWSYPNHPEQLWDQFKVNICDDLHPRLIAGGRLDPTDEDIFDYGLHLLNKILMKSRKSLELNFPSMPTPQQQWDILHGNTILQDQLAYDAEAMMELANTRYQSFNAEQKHVFDTVMDLVRNDKGMLFFLNSAGGCGKTYVCNAIAAAVRGDNNVALCVASSAIAALLLDGGRTAHSRFSIPIPVDADSTCPISMNSDLHGLLAETKLIIWDEAPMQHRHGPEAMNRTLDDLFRLTREGGAIFGGITVMFVGDFCQTLPVVPRASRAQIINACLRKSRLWNHIHVLNLTQNMRLDRTPESDTFAEWLLQVGDGHNLAPDKTVELPQTTRLHDNSVQSLVNAIYPELQDGNKPDEFFLNHSILSSRNDSEDNHNSTVLDILPGLKSTHHSVDKVNEHGALVGARAAKQIH